MECNEVREALLDDVTDSEALHRHAAGCPACAALLEEDRLLRQAVAAWVASSPQPPAELEARIAAIPRQARAASAPAPFRPAPSPTPRWTWPKAAAALAAAALLVVAGAGIASLPWGGGEAGGEVERALADAEAARTGYAEAIARLEAEAGAVLGRASDPDLSPDRAAVLLAYRGRLAHLDAVIADVEGFLQANPGHSGGHMVLLAAYKEKTEVLREVLARRTGESSS